MLHNHNIFRNDLQRCQNYKEMFSKGFLIMFSDNILATNLNVFKMF